MDCWAVGALVEFERMEGLASDILWVRFLYRRGDSDRRLCRDCVFVSITSFGSLAVFSDDRSDCVCCLSRRVGASTFFPTAANRRSKIENRKSPFAVEREFWRKISD